MPVINHLRPFFGRHPKKNCSRDETSRIPSAPAMHFNLRSQCVLPSAKRDRGCRDDNPRNADDNALHVSSSTAPCTLLTYNRRDRTWHHGSLRSAARP